MSAADTAFGGKVAVFDIGKTHLKLSLIDADGRLLSQSRCANRSLPAPPYPHFDVDAAWDWLLRTLSALPQRRHIDAIIATTHGATLALLGDEGLALPVLDYEFDGMAEIQAEYDAQRDAYDQTFSPALPGGLNAGRQLYWQARHFPEAFAATRTVVAYPQYWAWRLCGVAAGEITSWGCHSDLWDARGACLSAMVARLGWTPLFPPLRQAGDTLGVLLPEVAARSGLRPDCRVLCGIHDSNASLVKHLYGARAPAAPLSVVSSGTWALVAEIGAPLSLLDPARDMLANIDAWGRPVACSRFMGGREFEVLNAGRAEDCDLDDIAALLAGNTRALPSFASFGGPWPGRRGEIRGPAPATPGAAHALATLYLALVTDDCLARLGSRGDIVIEGAFTASRHYASLLAALRPGQAVWVSDDRSGTTGGAYLLARQPAGYRSARSRAAPLLIAGLAEYAASWRAELP